MKKHWNRSTDTNQANRKDTKRSKTSDSSVKLKRTKISTNLFSPLALKYLYIDTLYTISTGKHRFSFSFLIYSNWKWSFTALAKWTVVSIWMPKLILEVPAKSEKVNTLKIPSEYTRRMKLGGHFFLYHLKMFELYILFDEFCINFRHFCINRLLMKR